MDVLIRSFFLALGACAALVVFPGIAVAQQKVFVDGIVELATVLEGTFGDEGARIGPALDRLSDALAAWDRTDRASNLDPHDPVIAYYAVRHSTTTLTPGEVERARDVMTVAYRKILNEAARPAVPPFQVSPLQQKAADTPVLPLARYAKGYARLVAGDYDGALAELRTAAATDPLVTDPSTRSVPIMQAVAALREGRVAEARSLVDRTRTLPDSSEAHRIRGLLYWASSEYDKSVEQFTMAIDRDPSDERSHLARARVLTLSGRNDDALRALLKTVQAFPDSSLAHWSLGLHYEELNRHDDARREIGYATAGAIVGRAGLYTAIGRLAGNATDVPAAIDAFTHAVDANPNDPAAHKYLAGALLQLDRVDEAFIEFVATLLIDPLDGDAHAGIGRIHLDAGRYADAVEALRRAVEVAPNDIEARYALATAFTRMGKTQEAAQEFDRVEQAQRRALAERRRTMSLEVLKEEAARARAMSGKVER